MKLTREVKDTGFSIDYGLHRREGYIQKTHVVKSDSTIGEKTRQFLKS